MGLPFMRLAVAASRVSLLLATALAPGGTWTVSAPIPVRVQEHSGALFVGRIYIAGGFDSADAPTAVAYRYDPARDAWARIADLPQDRHHMPLVVVGDTLYAVGGLEGQQLIPQTTLWMYRADRSTWELRAPLPAPRGASAAVAAGGKLIVVGGFGVNRALLDSIAVYDPATNHWVN